MPHLAAPRVDIQGLLLVDKPSGPTSYDMIRWVKRALSPKKIGHCGTLDPLASGLLLLLFGKATKKQSTLMGYRKVYRCVMRCGLQTDSGDITGRITAERPVEGLSAGRIDAVLREFLGSQTQIPPMYSALKRGGVPLYKLARQGKTVERAPRSIVIETIDLVGIHSTIDFEFRVCCSSGTYVRSLVEDIGRKLGTVATVVSLVREEIGPFRVKDAVDGNRLRTDPADQLLTVIRPVEFL